MLESLLFLHSIPEEVLSDKEAQEVALKILLQGEERLHLVRLAI